MADRPIGRETGHRRRRDASPGRGAGGSQPGLARDPGAIVLHQSRYLSELSGRGPRPVVGQFVPAPASDEIRAARRNELARSQQAAGGAEYAHLSREAPFVARAPLGPFFCRSSTPWEKNFFAIARLHSCACR